MGGLGMCPYGIFSHGIWQLANLRELQHSKRTRIAAAHQMRFAATTCSNRYKLLMCAVQQRPSPQTAFIERVTKSSGPLVPTQPFCCQ